MSSVAEMEQEKQQFQEQLDLVLSQLKDDPDNTELVGLKEEMTELITILNDNLAAVQPAATKKEPSPPPQQEKWSRDKRKDEPEQKQEEAANYQVNDTVLAKWYSGDRGFYPARITSITGSSNAPIYVVKFKSYDDTETLSARDIKPISNKRKADGPPAPPSAPAAPLPGVVSSAGATVYPDAKKPAPLDADADKPPKPKKIRAKKELEAGKSKWQDFNSKSKFGKSNKKDSMFRTPEGIHGRVGFTGSGKSMRKDPSRSRHIYQIDDEAD